MMSNVRDFTEEARLLPGPPAPSDDSRRPSQLPLLAPKAYSVRWIVETSSDVTSLTSRRPWDMRKCFQGSDRGAGESLRQGRRQSAACVEKRNHRKPAQTVSDAVHHARTLTSTPKSPWHVTQWKCD